ncbi:hypothetical protein GQ457_18G016630 [Hibiscus cannabinus]
MNFVDWIRVNLANPSYFASVVFEWDIFFGSTLWVLWKHRNLCALDPSQLESFVIWRESWRVYNQCIQGLNMGLVSQWICRSSLPSGGRWQPPSEGWHKLNTDGARVVSNSMSSCGGVIRDCNGGWRIVFSRFVGICSVLEAELWGVVEGLRLAWDAGYRRSVLEVDSLEVFRLIHGHSSGVRSFNMVHSITDFLHKDWTVQICHIPRSANMVADALAKLSRTNHVSPFGMVNYACQVYHVVLDEVLSLFQNDVSHPLGVE